MKKLTIISGIITLMMILLWGIIIIFKSGISELLIKNDKLRLAATLYGDELVLNKINEKNYISIKDSYEVDTNDKNDKNNEDMNKYEEEILTNDDNSEYKIINMEIDGYKSYLVVIYDASKVKLVSSKAFNKNNTGQQTVKEICKRYDGLVCINGGGFVDWGTGSDVPLGYVIEDGKITWDSKGTAKLIGFNKENKLVLLNTTGEEALNMGVRDALEFGPFLIKDGKILVDEDEKVGGFLRASRVAIAQRQDGIVLFLVTEGMHAKGPTVYQIAETLKKYGAYNAGNLDGGASSSLVVEGKLINNPLNIYGQKVNGGAGRSVVSGFGLMK